MQEPTKVTREQLSPPAVMVARTAGVNSPGDAANTCTQFLKFPGNSAQILHDQSYIEDIIAIGAQHLPG